MDFPVSAGLQWIKQSETPTGSWKKGNYVGETSFKEVRYPKKPISVISFVRTYFGGKFKQSDLVNYGIFESSCIFICLYALKLSTQLHRNQRMLSRLMKERKCLQSRLADGQVQGQEVGWKVSTHFNGLWSATSSLQIFINHCERMRFERSTQKIWLSPWRGLLSPIRGFS